MRLIVETEAAAIAAERATRADIERPRSDVERLRDAIADGYRPPEDLGFHLDVVRATHNASLTRLSGSIVAFYQLEQHLPSERDVIEHSQVLDAIRGRAPEAAWVAMHQPLLIEVAPRRSDQGAAISKWEAFRRMRRWADGRGALEA